MKLTIRQKIPLGMVNSLSAVFIMLIISADGYVQKFPNVQKISLRAPEKIKIDGNPAEWGRGFQAYNTATNLFYSMANNDENLCLLIRTNDPDAQVKMSGRRIIISIRTSGEKDDKGAIVIAKPRCQRAAYTLAKTK